MASLNITLPKRINARELYELCRYVNNKPFISLQRHEGDRVKVMRNGEWIATVVPPGLLCDEQFVLLSYPYSEHEFRVDSLGKVAQLVSVLQQANCNWDAVYEYYYPDDGLDLDF